jgi:tetratricopeptide (TPR) repeat protein
MITVAMDEEARKKGYANAEEFNQYLSASSNPVDAAKAEEEANAMPLAPGLKKRPEWALPGAYPGDKTKIGKEYDKALENPDAAEASLFFDERPRKQVNLPAAAPVDGSYELTYVKQTDKMCRPPALGQKITYRTEEDGPEQHGEVGGPDIPFALDLAARKMKIGDIANVTGKGEYAASDEEDKNDMIRSWRFEILSLDAKAPDKFGMDAYERVDKANELRLKGNDAFKKGKLYRAMDYYERGSSLMDVLEAEDMGAGMPGSKIDKVAAEKNKRIWACQKPLLLNWALILIKLARFEEAERKCTEVLMDMDMMNVKAFFRRGVCNIHLGNHEQARTDLRRAAELDTSIAAEAERELLKVESIQKEVDKEVKPLAQKLVKGYIDGGDRRSQEPPPVEEPVKPTRPSIPEILEQQRTAAERDGIDDDTYRRQREAIYNAMLAPQQAAAADREDEPVAPAKPKAEVETKTDGAGAEAAAPSRWSRWFGSN